MTHGDGLTERRALLVARVSTDAQFKHGYSVPTQLDGMRRYSAAQHMGVVDELVDDCSGTIPMYDRPGGRRVYEAIRSRAIDALVFYTIDRASRDEDVIDFLLLRRELRNTGIELHFADTGRSGDDSITALIEYLKVSEAGRELKKIVERTSRGRIAKAAAGKWVGAGHTHYGYTRRGKKATAKLVKLEREARIVRQIFDWCTGAGGKPPVPGQTIAARLTAAGIPTPSRGKAGRGWFRATVNCILANPVYIGELHYAGTVTIHPELAIVDGQQWAVAQAQLERNKLRARSHPKRQYLLGSHLKCSCRKAMIGVTKQNRQDGPEFRYYTCGARWSGGHMSECRARSVRMAEADEKVWGWLAGLLSSEENIRAGLRRLAERREIELAPRRARLALLDELIGEAQAKIERWLNSFGNEADAYVRDTVQAKIRETARVRDDLTAERELLAAELGQGALQPEEEQHIVDLAAEFRAGLGEADYATKRYLLDRLDVRGLLVEDAAGRWLDCTCAVPGWQLSLTLAAEMVPAKKGSCARVRRDWTRVVIFSASIPLDGRALSDLELTANLFERQGAQHVSNPVQAQ